MSKLTIHQIIETIRQSLSPDLLSNKWQIIVDETGENNPVAGHCAIATEALYDILGGCMAGYTPVVCAYYYDEDEKRHFGRAQNGAEQMTHWWLRGPKGCQRGQGDVLDATVRQYKKPFPYECGRASGFMSPTPPSKRARILIARVEKILGVKNIARFREDQIKKFEDAGGKVKVQIAMQRRRTELAPLNKKFGL